MNVNSGGPHILLFERDQQLTTLLSSELAQAGYEVHAARTAVEVFDAIARFPVRLVMVDLAQAQAGRREFWVALDAQRRGRGVQVFTFRCANVGGYGPEDPDERIETVLTDMEVDGPGGVGRLVEAVRGRVPGSTVTTSAPARQAHTSAPESYQQNNSRTLETSLPPLPRQASPVYQPLPQASPVYQQPRQPLPPYQPAPSNAAPAPQPQAPAAPVYQPAPQPQAQPLQGVLHPQPQDMQAPASPPRPAEAPRPTGPSTFTDKIRAVFYPSSQSFSSVAETANAPYPANAQSQPAPQYQNADVQPRPRASQRFAEAEYPPVQNNQYPPAQNNQEETFYPSAHHTAASAPQQSYAQYVGSSASANARISQEESGLDQLSRMLRESQPTPQHTTINGHIQHSAPYPGATVEAQETQDFRSQMLVQSPAPGAHQGQHSPLYTDQQSMQDVRVPGAHQGQHSPLYTEQQSMQDVRVPGASQDVTLHGNGQNASARAGLTIDPQEIQDFRSQIMQAARLDEAHERSNAAQPRQVDVPGVGTQLRASPIQDIPFEQEVAHRRGSALPASENTVRPAMTVLQPTQAMPQVQLQPQMVPQTPQVQAPSQVSAHYQAVQQPQPAFTEASSASHSGVQPRPAVPFEAPPASANTSQLHSASPLQEASPQMVLPGRHTSGPLELDEELELSEQIKAGLQQSLSRRPEVRTSDDTLLDIVKSLPPMSPAPQPPAPQPQVLNGRATRSLGSVLLEGHLVPQERLQVAQHVQRMMRGVDLNYQLGEILLMFKLLTPDQLLAASLVSYGMISTVQISGLGRIRQELHAMGLEYDLESLLILFRILTPEQLREVRASWSS